MRAALLILFALATAVGLAAVADGNALEGQLRADVVALLRAKAPQRVQADAQDKAVEQMVSDVKRAFPSLLADVTKSDPPSDEALRRALGDLDRVGAGAPRPVLISFYAELWKSGRIGPHQRIIFERLAHAIAEHATPKPKNG